jgi:hypothetical protein
MVPPRVCSGELQIRASFEACCSAQGWKLGISPIILHVSLPRRHLLTVLMCNCAVAASCAVVAVEG